MRFLDFDREQLLGELERLMDTLGQLGDSTFARREAAIRERL